MRLLLPATIEDYLALVDKDVRTQIHKAERLGYTAKWTTEVAGTDIAEIWDSWDGTEKQGRPTNRIVGHFNPNMGFWTTKGCWPYSYYPHTQGYLDLIQVYDEDDTVVAYLELARGGGEAVVFSTMTHKAYLKYGLSKFLFVEAVRGLIERGDKALYYMKPDYIERHPERATFVRDLGFERVA